MRTFVTQPALDRAMTGARIVMTFGPVAVPSVEAVRAAFHTLATSGNPVRLGYRTHRRGQWEWIAPAISSRLREIVRFAPAGPGRPDHSLECWLADNLIDDLPVQLALQEDYVSISIDHSLFDAQAAVRLPVLLFDTVRGAGTSTALTASSRAPLARALIATFGARPRSWSRLARDVRHHRARQRERPLPFTMSTTDSSERKVPLAAGSALTRHAFGSCDSKTMRVVRRWGRERGISAVPTLIYLVSCALEASGIATSGEGFILVDLRRYLPAGVSTTGNFIASLPVRVRDPRNSPADLGVDVKAGIASGRPLASIAARLMSQRLRRAVPPSADTNVPVPSHARLSMSVLPSMPGWERLPWDGDASRSIRLTTDSAEPGTISWIAAPFGGRTYFSATFRSDVFSDVQIERAMALATEHPLRVLDAIQ